MSHITDTIKEFREKFPPPMLLGQNQEQLCNFLLERYLSYLQEIKKRLEKELKSRQPIRLVTEKGISKCKLCKEDWEDCICFAEEVGLKTAINSELDIIQEEIKEVEGLMKTL